ncbi:hypothetical protein BpHYR1_007170 [Brachionus plicatilis]|uniref:Uncharacterized protein n=1 Tax=Brachionus plicatilis TaxID=10195 RepID=A0A3M7S6E3_BRAPC|nr:hypothetical protein BpHYR1_007170 [Brachionus plicatilis]
MKKYEKVTGLLNPICSLLIFLKFEKILTFKTHTSPKRLIILLHLVTLNSAKKIKNLCQCSAPDKN